MKKDHLPISEVEFIGTKDPFQHHKMQIGDPFTLTNREPFIDEITKSPVKVGSVFTRWFDTGEPGRAFRITAIHAKPEGLVTYESVFIGFTVVDEVAKVWRIVPDYKGLE